MHSELKVIQSVFKRSDKAHGKMHSFVNMKDVKRRWLTRTIEEEQSQNIIDNTKKDIANKERIRAAVIKEKEKR